MEMSISLNEQDTLLVGAYLAQHQITAQDLLYRAIMDKIEDEKIYGPFDNVSQLMESLNAED